MAEPTIKLSDPAAELRQKLAAEGDALIARIKGDPSVRQTAADAFSSIRPFTFAGYEKGRSFNVDVFLIGGTSQNPIFLEINSAKDFLLAQAAARLDGVELTPTSGFRLLAEQQSLYDRHLAGDKDVPFAAPPGFSNHQTGRAIDIAVSSTASAPYLWMQAYGAQYGFTKLDSPEDKVHWVHGTGSVSADADKVYATLVPERASEYLYLQLTQASLSKEARLDREHAQAAKPALYGVLRRERDRATSRASTLAAGAGAAVASKGRSAKAAAKAAKEAAASAATPATFNGGNHAEALYDFTEGKWGGT